MTTHDSLTIRRSRPADARTLLDLAGLDSAHPLSGEVLIAEVDGEALAAIELGSGRVVADPFRHTAGPVELLRMRAELLSSARGTARGRSALSSLLRPA